MDERRIADALEGYVSAAASLLLLGGLSLRALKRRRSFVQVGPIWRLMLVVAVIAAIVCRVYEEVDAPKFRFELFGLLIGLVWAIAIISVPLLEGVIDWLVLSVFFGVVSSGSVVRVSRIFTSDMGSLALPDRLSLATGVLLLLSMALSLIIACTEHRYSYGSLQTPLLESVDAVDYSETCTSPEMDASLYSYLTFSWMGELLRKGFKKQLTQTDLLAVHPEDRTKVVNALFEDSWERENQSRRASLWIAMARSHGRPYLIAGLYKLFQDILQFVGPLLLTYLLADIKQGKGITDVYWIVAGMFFSALVQSLFLHRYFHVCFRTGMRVRSALVAAVYKKSLRISPSAKATYATGDIVNLMSIDCQRLQDLLPYLQMIWSAPFQAIVCIVLLWRQIGWASLMGIAVMIALMPLNAYTTKHLRACQKSMMDIKDKRVRQTTELLSNIKTIKLYAWEQSFGDRIRELRNTEISYLSRYFAFDNVQTVMWIATPVLISLSGFATFSAIGGQLTPGRAFATLALFNLLRFPISFLPYVVNSIVEAQISVKRLQEFLTASELKTLPRASATVPCGTVVVDGCSFSWDDEGKDEALSNVKFRVDPGELVVVIGETASGKSALLSGILGELHSCGTAMPMVSGTVAYTSQVPWIQNASVKDNILFGLPFDPKWYNQVIDASALRPDLDSLPAGDATEIGARGINLSGGQKHRVALARAVYQKRDIYLLDDPLSAVDAHVSKQIVESCLIGILADKTRILVTHSSGVLKCADRIVRVAGRRVVASGSYAEMMRDPEFGAFVDKLETSHMSSTRNDDALSENEPISSDDSNRSSKLLEESDSENRASPKSTCGAVKSNSDAADDNAARLVGEEHREVGHVTMKVYLEYMKQCGGAPVVALILVGLSAVMIGNLATSLWLAYWSDHVAEHAHSVGYYLGIYALLSIGIVLAGVPVQIAAWRGSIRSSTISHENLLSSILRAPQSFFDTTPVGRILNRFSKDQYVIDESLAGAIMSYLRCLFAVIGVLFAIVYATPWFAVVLIPMAIAYRRVQDYFIASSRELKRWDSVLRSPVISNFAETLDGVNTIRAFSKEKQFSDENLKRVDSSLEAYYPSVAVNRWLAIRLEFLGNLIVTMSALLAAISGQSIGPALAGMSVSYALSVTQTLNWLVRMSSDRETNIVSVERNLEYCRIESEAPLYSKKTVPDDWPQSGAIVFRNVWMRYRDGLEPVLRGLDLEIAAGERVGCVGRTGAGKSSMLLALLRLTEPYEGEILVDGINLSELGLFQVRSRVSLIPQDPVLFNGTVRMNLDPFDNRTDDELWDALTHSYMDEHVRSLPEGLQHMVADSGSNFSVGQRQLICLARALLRKSKILLMDEATSSVSLRIGELIQNTIRDHFASCTLLTIAHRLETVMEYDRVVVIDAGKVVETGNPRQLAAQSSSFFASMVASSSTQGGPS